MNQHSVLLVFANPVYYPAAQPYGLSVLAAALSERGVSSRIILPYMASNPMLEVKRAYETLNPTIVGFSLRNLDPARFHYEDNAEKTFIDELIKLIKALRSNNSIITLGGSGFSIAPLEILNLTAADIGFIGPSEFDFAEFCVRVIEQQLSIREAAAGLSSAILPDGIVHIPQVTALGSPNQLEGLAVEYAKLTGGTIPLRTKAGCSMKCSYCVVPSTENSILRPWDDIRKELKLILKAGLGDRVFIADGEFNLPSIERAIELCHRIRAEFGMTLKWTCYLEAGYITSDLLNAMRTAGCSSISLTADSFSRETRIGFIKVTRPEVAIKSVQLCLESGIHTNINLLFGGPNETLETMTETAEIAKGFNDDGASLSVTIGLRVYPNTPLAIMATKEKYCPYFQPCQRLNWLGIFCSPVPAKELATHVTSILPPSPTISYTNNKNVAGAENDFYHQIAIGANLLAQRKFGVAKKHFLKIAANLPSRMEPKLGILKAEYGLVNSPPNFKSDRRY